MLSGRNAKIFFVLLFALITIAGNLVNFSKVIGTENQSFTLFQFFGPAPGAFLGPAFGIASVLLSQLASMVILGKEFSFINIARLFPMLFAAVAFGTFLRKRNWKDVSIIIPVVAIIAFVLHPVGREAWLYSMYWLIPIGARLFSKNLFFRSLSATFTAHAVGSIIYLYSVPMTALQWLSLIPVVAFERGLFALGITVSFIVFSAVLHRVESYFKTGAINIEKNYSLSGN